MDLLTAHRERSKRAWASSGWATSGCRWPSSSRAPGFHVVGFDVDEDKVAELNAGRSYIPDVPSEHVAEVVKAARSCATTDRDVARRRRHHRHLRADAAPQDARPRSVLRRPGGRNDGATCSARASSIILESTTYPGTTDEVVQPALEARGLKAGDGFLSRVLAGARRSGQPDLHDQEHPEGRRRHQRSRAPRWRWRSTAR